MINNVLKIFLIGFVFITELACFGTSIGKLFPSSQLQSVDFSQIKIQDEFWLPKIELVQEVTLPHLLDIAEAEGKIDNFRIIGGKEEAKIRLHNAGDSDVYKLIEAAAYSFSIFENDKLKMRIDQLIDDIASAQQPDGYINTQFTLPDKHPFSPDLDTIYVRRFGYGKKDKWNSTFEGWPYAYSQLYCSGHLMEAAVAYYRATGNRKLLDVAIKNAEHISEVFSNEKIKMYADHPQVEIGLNKLYEVTGDIKYQHLAENFCRYITFARPRDIMVTESTKPLAEQTEAWSHCVRTGYIYAAATNCIRTNGSEDLGKAIFSLWKNLTGKKMYVHGGVGNGTKFEQHGYAYDLSILNTYSESCAQIAQCQWNHELNLLTGDTKFADVIEWEAYNGALSGFGLDGKTFLYSNKLNIDTVGRKDYHSGVRTSYLFCCPSKLPGFITGIHRWIYAKENNNIYVNLFIGSEVSTKIGNETLTLKQETQYPWNGEVVITVKENPSSPIGVNIRIPSWNKDKTPIPLAPYFFKDTLLNGYSITLNGNVISASDIKSANGYIKIEREYKKGDKIEINFEMPVRRIYTKRLVDANKGRVVLSRGPLIYALEGVDNSFVVLKMILPKNNEVFAVNSELFEKSVLLKGKGIINQKEVEFTAIPYYLWQNRGIYSLATLLIEDPNKIYLESINDDEINTDG